MGLFSKRISIGKYSIALWQLFSIGFSLVLVIAAYGFRHNIFKALINPQVPFQVDSQGKAPDYTDASAWAKRPQNIDNNRLAVFYIHATTYYDGKEGWNADIDNANARKILTQEFIPNYVAPFAKSSEIFMPYYRQAALLATLAFNEDTKDALEFAYSDIETAFDRFLEAIGPNRKFAIVGMNQGALHGVHLLQAKIANTPLESRLIAAYLIDVAIPVSDFTTQNFGNLKLCNGPQANNCIVAFRTLDEKDKRDQYLFRKRAPVYSIDTFYSPLSKRQSICINPLNGGAKVDANKNENKGSVSANDLEEETKPPYLPHETGAKCVSGLLLVDEDRARALKPKTLELGTLFKVPSYNLFYEAMENDFSARVSAQK